MKISLKSLTSAKSTAWEVLRSPRTMALLKLGTALVAVIHAVDELLESPKKGKQAIGFRPQDDEE
jgi:hypothetical protein